METNGFDRWVDEIVAGLDDGSGLAGEVLMRAAASSPAVCAAMLDTGDIDGFDILFWIVDGYDRRFVVEGWETPGGPSSDLPVGVVGRITRVDDDGAELWRVSLSDDTAGAWTIDSDFVGSVR